MASGDDRNLRSRMETIFALEALSYYPDDDEQHQHNNSRPSSIPNPAETRRSMAEAQAYDGRLSFGARLDSSSPPAEGFYDGSDSEMTDALDEDEGGVSIGLYPEGDMDMETIVQQLVNTPGFRPNGSSATIPDDSADGNESSSRLDLESPMLDAESSPALSVHNDDDDDDDDHDSDGTGKLYQDDDDEEEDEGDRHLDPAPSQQDIDDLSDVDYADFYRSFDYDSMPQVTEVPVTPGHGDHNYFSDGEDLGVENHFPASVIHGTTHERNLTVDQFVHQWLVQASSPHLRYMLPLRTPVPHPSSLSILTWAPPPKIRRPSKYRKVFYDIQQIPWWDIMRVKRTDARALRDACYTSYHNLEYSPRYARHLPNVEHYFREKAMYTKHKATIEHFQLRNLMSVVSHNTVEFAHESKLYSWIPAYDDLTCLIDLSKPAVGSCFEGPVKISTMASQHDVSIAGGFCGEYAMRAMGTEGAVVEGFVTKDFNGITNHIDVVKHRTSRSPMAIFASNDKHLRVLDCETNTFIADHSLSRAINCTATSNDGRLRVIIGDSPDAWVIEADTGRPVHPLRGHRDFGFACAWSPDMRHIATSNQDKTVIIWDARTWRILETIESDVAGYRSLRFSPVGGGSRTLLLCEPADRIAVVNAQTYQSRQVHDFFGEVGGADYTPDGGAIWVANTDRHFGGLMEYDRRQWGERVETGELPNDWLSESELDDDERCVLSAKERRLRFWGNLSDEEHDELLLSN